MMNDTQYTPWLELGIDELAYYKKRFLETCAELAAWKADYWRAVGMQLRLAGFTDSPAQVDGSAVEACQ